MGCYLVLIWFDMLLNSMFFYTNHVKCDSTKKCQETNLIVNFLETQFKAQQA